MLLFEIKRDIFSLYVLVEVLTEVLSGVQVYKGKGEDLVFPLTQESLVARPAWISDRLPRPCLLDFGSDVAPNSTGFSPSPTSMDI